VKELYVFCEGETEQGFCSQVLRPHLFPQHDGLLHPPLIAHSKHHGVVSRGGIGKYAALERDIRNTLKSRTAADVFVTTMIDLYKLVELQVGHEPDVSNRFPECLLQGLHIRGGVVRVASLLGLAGKVFWKYETLLFADPEGFRIAFDACEAAIHSLKAIAASFPSIEHINDGATTAPSKRIIDVLPAYDGLKPTAGPDIAEFIGLPAIRAKCPHFDAWLSRLEKLWQGH
jgi:hypothetical protein